MNSQDNLLGHVVRIVSAHVSNNPTPLDQVSGLIEQVHAALEGITRPQAPAETVEIRPAVPIRRSVADEHVICLECGRHLRTLKRHIGAEHGLDPAGYRARWGLGSDYPMTAPAYSARRSEMARSLGLGRPRAMAPPLARARRKTAARRS